MAIASTCGHDRRCNFVDSDDIQRIAAEYHKWEKTQEIMRQEDAE